MVHLELTSSLSTNEFLQAFNRLISRRGICSTVWSDNAKTFKCADRQIRRLYKSQSSESNQSWDDIDQDELQAKLVSKGIKWTFIVNVPLGVVAGGKDWYEMLKSLFARSQGKICCPIQS